MKFRVGEYVRALEGPTGQKEWKHARITSAWESGTPRTGYGCFYTVALDVSALIVATPASELRTSEGLWSNGGEAIMNHRWIVDRITPATDDAATFYPWHVEGHWPESETDKAGERFSWQIPNLDGFDISNAVWE